MNRVFGILAFLSLSPTLTYSGQFTNVKSMDDAKVIFKNSYRPTPAQLKNTTWVETNPCQLGECGTYSHRKISFQETDEFENFNVVISYSDAPYDTNTYTSDASGFFAWAISKPKNFKTKIGEIFGNEQTLLKGSLVIAEPNDSAAPLTDNSVIQCRVLQGVNEMICGGFQNKTENDFRSEYRDAYRKYPYTFNDSQTTETEYAKRFDYFLFFKKIKRQ